MRKNNTNNFQKKNRNSILDSKRFFFLTMFHIQVFFISFQYLDLKNVFSGLPLNKS
jgi:hypothetical protein